MARSAVVAALSGEVFVRGSLIVNHDPAATARNILGSETWRRVKDHFIGLATATQSAGKRT